MDKTEALKIILNNAKVYRAHLENKNVLFIFGSKDKTEYIETLFLPRNYLHLTGIELTNNISKHEFYKRCIKNKVNLSDFKLKSDGTTKLKLSVLPQIMQISHVAKMMGDYNNTGAMLYTEKITGTSTACLGFILNNGFYIPNTVLKDDIRDITNRPQSRILAIYSKDKSEEKYSKRTYLAKNVNDTLFPKEILDLITKVDMKL